MPYYQRYAWHPAPSVGVPGWRCLPRCAQCASMGPMCCQFLPQHASPLTFPNLRLALSTCLTPNDSVFLGGLRQGTLPRRAIHTVTPTTLLAGMHDTPHGDARP